MCSPKPFIFSTVSELQCLSNKLNLSNSSAVKFDVETTRPTLNVLINLLFCQPHTGKGFLHGDVLAKDSFLKSFCETREQWSRSCRRARANQCLQLPGLSIFAVVPQSFVQRTGQSSITSVRTQTQVDAISCAFTCGLAHKFGYCLRQFDEIFAIADLAAFTCGGGCALVGIDEYEINVGGVVKFE